MILVWFRDELIHKAQRHISNRRQTYLL